MDATQFTSISGPRTSTSPRSPGAWLGASVASLVDTCSTLANGTCAAFSQCMTHLAAPGRRSQFDAEHQRSLLSCHSTEDAILEGPAHVAASPYYPDEQAMLELRRRVQTADVGTLRHAMARLPRLPPSVHSNATDKPVPAAPGPSVPLKPTEDLGAGSISKGRDDVQADDVRRLSVDELLALRVPSPTASSASTLSVEVAWSADNASMQDEAGVEDTLSEDAVALRTWLRAIDATKGHDYVAYAPHWEAQGFQRVEDLAQLDASDVEQAMSEVGIAKFAHRARIRKAILHLHQEAHAAAAH